jgi:membrane fusion protein, multidrug efflux system
MKKRILYGLAPLALIAILWTYGTQMIGEASGETATLADSTQIEAGPADSTLTDSVAIDSAKTDSAARKIDAILVETAPATSGSISSYLRFKSTVETEAAVEIYPQISGQVERIIAEEGDRVVKGDTLLLIDDAQLQLAAREAQVDLDHFQGNFARVEEMFRRKLISDQEYENKCYELNQARLRWKRADLELNHAIILAPFSGVISERQVQTGARVGSSTRLFSLIKLDDMIARVFIPGQYMVEVGENQEAHLTSSFLGDRQFQGWVKRISPVLDPQSGTFKVTVGVRDRWEFLRPGVFVDVQIVTDTHSEAVLIPKQAVVYDGKERYVFVVEDDRARKIHLEAGYENGEFVEALSAIEPGAPIIVVGQNGLRHHTRVKVGSV